jgi:hypothetical protein
MSELHRTDIADGSLLELSCGALSIIHRFDEMLVRYGTPTSSSAISGTALDLVLGMIAIRDRLMTAFDLTESPSLARGVQERKTDWLR